MPGARPRNYEEIHQMRMIAKGGSIVNGEHR